MNASNAGFHYGLKPMLSCGSLSPLSSYHYTSRGSRGHLVVPSS